MEVLDHQDSCYAALLPVHDSQVWVYLDGSGAIGVVAGPDTGGMGKRDRMAEVHRLASCAVSVEVDQDDLGGQATQLEGVNEGAPTWPAPMTATRVGAAATGDGLAVMAYPHGPTATPPEGVVPERDGRPVSVPPGDPRRGASRCSSRADYHRGPATAPRSGA